jgi:hypothetical protein
MSGWTVTDWVSASIVALAILTVVVLGISWWLGGAAHRLQQRMSNLD